MSMCQLPHTCTNKINLLTFLYISLNLIGRHDFNNGSLDFLPWQLSLFLIGWIVYQDLLKSTHTPCWLNYVHLLCHRVKIRWCGSLVASSTKSTNYCVNMRKEKDPNIPSSGFVERLPMLILFESHLLFT